MDKLIIQEFYKQIKQDLERYDLAQYNAEERENIFKPYHDYLLPLVEKNNLHAILQFTSIMTELYCDEEEVITFLRRYEELFVNSESEDLRKKYYINLVYYYLAGIEVGTMKSISYQQLIDMLLVLEYSECPQACSLLGYCYYQLGNYQVASQYIAQGLKVRTNDFELYNYKLLDIYLNNRPVADHLNEIDFSTDFIKEEITELRQKVHLEQSDIQLVLGCNLADCVVHLEYN